MATLIEQLAPNETVERLEHSLAQELPAQTDALFPGLAEKIREGTASLEDVESFLRHVPSVPSGLEVPLLQFLRLKKGWLLLRHDRAKAALRESEEVLKISEPAPKAWTLKAIALLRLERFAEACKAFERAYQLQKHVGGEQDLYLKAWVKGWSGCALLWGLQGILQQESREAQKGVDEYLNVLDKTKAENLGAAVMKPLAEPNGGPLPEGLQEAFEELELMVRLLSIRDPFERWRAFTEEISKVWPKGVSAVDSVREQRE